MSEYFVPDDFAAYEKRNSFMGYNHIRIVSASPESSVVCVDITEDARNLNGFVHGGLLCAMADCVAGVTARSGGINYVTESSHMNYLRNVRSGTVYAKADTLKRGRRVLVTHVTVYTEDGTLLADGSFELIARE